MSNSTASQINLSGVNTDFDGDEILYIKIQKPRKWLSGKENKRIHNKITKRGRPFNIKNINRFPKLN